MIPLRDIIPSRTRPVTTVSLIVVNAVVFLYETSLSEAEFRVFVQQWGLVPADFNWVSVFTSLFLHAGWLHVIGNMWFLWIFGDNVEDRVGHGRFLVFYLLCAVMAALAQTFMAPGSPVPTVGASGAIAGVMGAYLVLYPRSRILTLIPLIILFPVVEIPAFYFLGFWFLIQLFSGVGSLATTGAASPGGVAFWAHVGGFLAGVVGVWVFRRPERQRVEWWHDLHG